MIDMSKLPTKLGTYAQTNNKKILTAILLAGLTFKGYFGNTLVTNDEVPLTELVMNDVLQPGGKDDFNPTEAGKFYARIGKVRACKADVTFTPTRIKSMWQSYIGMIDGKEISESEIPFQAFIFAKIIEKLKENLHLKAVFKGVYNPAGTSPGDTMNGLIRLIALARANDVGGGVKEIPAGNCTAATTITDANAGDVLNALLDKVDDAYYDTPMVCIVSPRTARAYNNWYQQTHGALPYNTEFKKTFLEGTQIEIVAEAGLSGTDHVIITPKENLFWLVDNESKLDNVVVEKSKRNIDLMIDFNAAPDFGIGKLIWTNIPAAA